MIEAVECEIKVIRMDSAGQWLLSPIFHFTSMTFNPGRRAVFRYSTLAYKILQNFDHIDTILLQTITILKLYDNLAIVYDNM